MEVRDKFKKGSRYRGIDKLGPPFLYMFLKTNNIAFKEQNFLEIVNLSRVDLIKLEKEIIARYPAYLTRNRTAIVLKKIKGVKKSFDLDPDFVPNCLKILNKFYLSNKNSTEDVMAGVSCVLCAIAMDINSVSMSSVCSQIGVSFSSVQNAIKGILASKKAPKDDFKGLKRSAQLIKDHLLKDIVEIKKREPKKPDSKRPLTKKKKNIVARLDIQGKNPQEIANFLDIEESAVRSVLFKFKQSYENLKAKKMNEKNEATSKLIQGGRPSSDSYSKFKHLGTILRELRTRTACESCNDFIYKLEFSSGKTLFVCKNCLSLEK